MPKFVNSRGKKRPEQFDIGKKIRAKNKVTDKYNREKYRQTKQWNGKDAE